MDNEYASSVGAILITLYFMRLSLFPTNSKQCVFRDRYVTYVLCNIFCFQYEYTITKDNIHAFVCHICTKGFILCGQK